MENTYKLLNFITAYIQKATAEQHMDIIIAGDTNLPGVNWVELTTSDSDYPAKAVLSFMSETLLSQYVDVPTRNNNILDVFLTNNSNLVLHTSAEETKLSDHNIVTVLTNQSIKPLPPTGAPTFPKHTFRDLHESTSKRKT